MAGGGGDGPTLSKSSIAYQFGTFLPRRTLKDDSDFDITAMIDLVFMMNIFFLVTSLTKSMNEVDLPRAEFCLPANEADHFVITIRTGRDPYAPEVLIGSDENQKPLVDPEDQREQIEDAMEKADEKQKGQILIKAEKNVLIRDVVRISTLASSFSGAKPLFAVMETDQKGE